MVELHATTKSRIAVAGATGRVGKALAAGLVDDPVDLVLLSRNPAQSTAPSGADLAKINFDDPQSLAAALDGADRLFLAHGTSDRQVANEIALIDAAVEARVAHIVKLSAMGPPTRLHPFDWHMQIEAYLATCDLGCTVLRPGPFVDILARSGTFVAQGNWGGAAGDGRINFIDTRDIAEVARLALLDDRHLVAQRAWHLTGPAAVSMAEIAIMLSKLLGRKINYRHRTPEGHRTVLIESGMTDMAADVALGSITSSGIRFTRKRRSPCPIYSAGLLDRRRTGSLTIGRYSRAPAADHASRRSVIGYLSRTHERLASVEPLGPRPAARCQHRSFPRCRTGG